MGEILMNEYVGNKYRNGQDIRMEFSWENISEN